jgi:hypothetical protein
VEKIVKVVSTSCTALARSLAVHVNFVCARRTSMESLCQINLLLLLCCCELTIGKSSYSYDLKTRLMFYLTCWRRLYRHGTVQIKISNLLALILIFGCIRRYCYSYLSCYRSIIIIILLLIMSNYKFASTVQMYCQFNGGHLYTMQVP